MKFIKENGMIIEEEDGIVHTWELFDQTKKSWKDYFKSKKQEKQEKPVDRRKNLSPAYRRQQEINEHVKPTQFNIFLFILLLVLFWPAAIFYIIWFKKRQNGKK